MFYHRDPVTGSSSPEYQLFTPLTSTGDWLLYLSPTSQRSYILQGINTMGSDQYFINRDLRTLVKAGAWPRIYVSFFLGNTLFSAFWKLF